MGVIGSIFSGIFGAHSANSAANAQAGAANNAAQLAHQDQQASLAFQNKVWDTTQQNEAPWLKAGGQAETQLSSLLGTPGQGLLTPWNEQFQAPTGATEQNDPGYQFRLNEGMKALQNSAAARGGLLSTGTAKQVQQYGQDYASNEYQNVYNRAYNEYSTRYNQFQTNQSNQFNRLSSLAGGGQVAVGQLGGLGQSAAGNVAGINQGNAALQGQAIQNAGTARASGYIGAGNAYQNMFGNINSVLSLAALAGGG